MRQLTLKHFRSINFVAFVCLAAALVLSSCSKKPQQAIVGKWNVQGQAAIVEFRSDGTMSTTDKGTVRPAKYKFTDDTHLEMEITVPAPNSTNNIMVQIPVEIAVHGDTADMTATMSAQPGAPASTQTVHLTRAK
jgi:hypothetical protein